MAKNIHDNAASDELQDSHLFKTAYGIEDGDANPFCVTNSVLDYTKAHPKYAWIKAGCGYKEYYDPEKEATFAPDETNALPDLTNHNSFLVDYLKTDEGKAAWEAMKDKKTALGVTLAKCIKTGMDNKGHPNIKTVGLVAGDEECFTGDFKPLFEHVTRARHGFMTGTHESDMDVSKLSNTDMDPFNHYVHTARVRTGRSVSGHRLPPNNSFAERRELEKKITDALNTLESKGGDLFKGSYFPLPGNKSNPQGDLPDGMTPQKGADLLAKGNLFQEPDSTLLLAGGMGRHWPDARGIWHNDVENLFVWLNEEDHMRIVSMQGSKGKASAEGKDMRAVAKRFMDACNFINEAGLPFMKSPELGWILTCPSNCGTGLRAGCQVSLKMLNMYLGKEWKAALTDMALQARGIGGVDDVGTDVFDISNADRMGKGDVLLVNICIEGIAFLVLCEHALNKFFTVDASKAEKRGYPSFRRLESKDKPSLAKLAHLDEAIEVARGNEGGPHENGAAQLVAAQNRLKELIPDLV